MSEPHRKKRLDHRQTRRNGRRIGRFVGVFAICIGVFRLFGTTEFYRQHVLREYLRSNALASAVMLQSLGQEVIATKGCVTSTALTLEIRKGCDAIEPTALVVAAVLAAPVSVFPKLLGTLGAVLLLNLANLVRIVSLYLVGLHAPRYFETLHVEVWQPLILLLGVFYWMFWFRSSLHRRETHGP
jgi:exosortase/archaeosortase family protein